ncbi:uncharacterized protein LOC135111905 [Scylla paramamosain]|uniref:uncharacterized protein LOC135111905 n=1 Tax=Scylla paramamosain TaxID=85552 RepID=UPI003083252B
MHSSSPHTPPSSRPPARRPPQPTHPLTTTPAVHLPYKSTSPPTTSTCSPTHCISAPPFSPPTYSPAHRDSTPTQRCEVEVRMGEEGGREASGDLVTPGGRRARNPPTFPPLPAPRPDTPPRRPRSPTRPTTHPLTSSLTHTISHRVQASQGGYRAGRARDGDMKSHVPAVCPLTGLPQGSEDLEQEGDEVEVSVLCFSTHTSAHDCK